MDRFSRRRVLRGIVGGGAVTVGLPLLNYFLNGNGNAFANGNPMPLRFGTWFWGLGINAKVFVPKKTGANYDIPEEIEALKPIQRHINLLTDCRAFRDSNPALCHYSGWIIGRSGQAPKAMGDRPGETYDITIANKIGRSTRFKTLTSTATGDTHDTFSYENANSESVPEFDPLNFYQRVFGPDFRDPNAPAFTPDPRVMVRKSVLSGVLNDLRVLRAKVGTEDKARLDQYLTNVRDLERQFEQQLTKPEPIASCVAPKVIESELPPGREVTLLTRRHKVMTDLMVLAVACDQTRVFNMAYSGAFADTIRAGYERPHHATTHEEGIDVELGYQTQASWFTRRSMEAWAYYVDAFSKIKEGAGTLLDNCFIVADSDTGLARVHSYEGLAMMTAGRAGGKLKTGIHIASAGAPTSQLAYTALRVMGVDVPSFGTGGNQTSKEIGEILI